MPASGEPADSLAGKRCDTECLDNTGNERRAGLGRDRPDVAFVPFEAALPVSCGQLPLAMEKGRAGC